MNADSAVLRQQETIRQSGAVNMFDRTTVQAIADSMDCVDLVAFIENASGEEYIEMATAAREVE
jgi:acyl carrier protein